MHRELDQFCGRVMDVGSGDDAADVCASVGRPERFAAVFERHHRVVWTYLARLGGPEVADDLAGEVFVTAFGRRATFDPERGEVRSWLYGIATNLWRMRARSLARSAAATHRLAAREDFSEVDFADGAVEALFLEGSHARVLVALMALSEADRELIVLYAWEQLSYVEIAAVLNVPIGTVRSRLARTRGRLRELTDRSGQVFDDPSDPSGSTS